MHKARKTVRSVVPVPNRVKDNVIPRLSCLRKRTSRLQVRPRSRPRCSIFAASFDYGIVPRAFGGDVMSKLGSSPYIRGNCGHRAPRGHSTSRSRLRSEGASRHRQARRQIGWNHQRLPGHSRTPAPPVGDLRWKPPARARQMERRAQSHRVRLALHARRCIYDDMIFRDPGISEDCLYLNVWTPAKPQQAQEQAAGHGLDLRRRLRRRRNLRAATGRHQPRQGRRRGRFHELSPGHFRLLRASRARQRVRSTTPPATTACWISSPRSNG